MAQIQTFREISHDLSQVETLFDVFCSFWSVVHFSCHSAFKQDFWLGKIKLQCPGQKLRKSMIFWSTLDINFRLSEVGFFWLKKELSQPISLAPACAEVHPWGNLIKIPWKYLPIYLDGTKKILQKFVGCRKKCCPKLSFRKWIFGCR